MGLSEGVGTAGDIFFQGCQGPYRQTLKRTKGSTWRKSENDSSLSFNLGQDAKLLAPYVDVFSSMVYHCMLGELVEWIG